MSTYPNPAASLPCAAHPAARPCPICGDATAAMRSIWDDRYGYPGRFTALQCGSCRHIIVDADMNPDQLSELYTRYYPRSSFDVEAWTPPSEVSPLFGWWHGLRASAFRWVPRNVRVLDIGCGFGESIGYHRNRGCDAHGVEADANILRVAERYGLQVKVGLFEPEVWPASSFDVVTLDQVIEHVTDPVSMLRGVWTVLKPGGMLIMATPNAHAWGARVFGLRWIHWHAPYHQQFFTTESLRRAAVAAGFAVEATQTVTNSAWLGFQWCHLAAPSTEGQPSVFWNSKLKRRLPQRLVFGLVTVANRLGVNAAITRLCDAIGRGDNRVFVLRKVSGG